MSKRAILKVVGHSLDGAELTVSRDHIICDNACGEVQPIDYSVYPSIPDGWLRVWQRTIDGDVYTLAEYDFCAMGCAADFSVKKIGAVLTYTGADFGEGADYVVETESGPVTTSPTGAVSPS